MAKKSSSKSAAVQKRSDSLLAVDPVAAPRFGDGKLRPYIVTEIPSEVTRSRTITRQEWPLLAFLFVLGCFVRLRNIPIPNSVVFDEVHFGGFARKYVLGRFFMDVHPPLAKMLFAAVASLGGFDGSFEFTAIGDSYPAHVPFVLMRSFSAVLGLATVFLLYSTLRASGVRPIVACATATLLLIENAFVTISKYILLDSPLLFFVASAVYAFKKFEIQKPFSMAWYRALFSCSISLGLAFSSKWVGLFTIAWAGVLCAIHMWLLIGDLQVKSHVIWKQAVTRASILLGVPVVLYLAFFSVHFSVLSHDGDGSAFMSSAFKAGLTGNTVPHSTTGPVGFGSVVSLRHINTRGGYLHSHKHFYPAGSKQQQVTLYPHIDTNNDWVIEPYNDTMPQTFVPIRNGDKIRLKHVKSGLRLHSHDEKPPVSDRDWQKEVSCYGFEGFGGDANDDWIVEIVQHKTKGAAKDDLRAIESVFRLRHAMSGHYLFSSDIKLPEEWGFGQQEVTSASQGARPLTHWYIETNFNEKFSGNDIVSYPALGFFQKFVESHKVMWNINSGLTSHHNWQSDPHEWPLLLRGINYWNKNHTQVYFIGNPVVWWTASACLFGFLVHAGISLIKWQAGAPLNVKKAAFNYNYQMFTYFVGWAIHYLPFFIMGRQLFLHHYLPAQYFAILGLGHFFDLLVTSSQRYSKPAYAFLVVFLTVTGVAYHTLSPLISGTPWTKGQCLKSKIVSNWDYDCNTFFDTPKQYYDFLLTSQTEAAKSAASVASASVVNEAKETPVVVELESRVLAASNDAHEEPPAAETHAGEWPFGDQVVQEENPQGELFDEATIGKEGNAEEAELPETSDEPESQIQEQPAQVAEPVEVHHEEVAEPVIASSWPEPVINEKPIGAVDPEIRAQQVIEQEKAEEVAH
ncbi:hypothetical protein OXX80_002264 [Metschnikowia pulcherrima]